MCHFILFLPGLALSIFLFLPFETALPSYLSIAGISLLIYFKIFKAMRQQVQTGLEGMLGRKGLVIKDIDPEGKIQYGNEIWYATTKGKRFHDGEPVKICGNRGLMLIVEDVPNLKLTQKNRKVF